MFDNPGGKLKVIAKELFWIGCAFTVLASLLGTNSIWMLLFVLIIGLLTSYISCLCLSAFGELVESNTAIKESNEYILETNEHILDMLNPPAEN